MFRSSTFFFLTRCTKRWAHQNFVLRDWNYIIFLNLQKITDSHPCSKTTERMFSVLLACCFCRCAKWATKMLRLFRKFACKNRSHAFFSYLPMIMFKGKIFTFILMPEQIKMLCGLWSNYAFAHERGSMEQLHFINSKRWAEKWMCLCVWKT